MANTGMRDLQTEMLRPMMSVARDVPLRAGFDHATSPELLGSSFDGWSRLHAEGPAFRSDIVGAYDLWYLLRYADIRAALQDHGLFSSRSCADAHLARLEPRIALRNGTAAPPTTSWRMTCRLPSTSERWRG